MKETLKAIEYRFYPTKDQVQMLEQTFGAVRFVWNNKVARFNEFSLCGPVRPDYSIKQLKEQFSFLSEVPYNALEQKLQDFKEFKNQFFKKNRKIKVERPRFKSKKDSKQSFRLNENGFKIHKDKLFLGKRIGHVKIKGSLKIDEIPNIRSVTVSRRGHRYFISVLYKSFIKPKEKTGLSVGLDLGLIHFLTDNYGNKLDNPKYLKKYLGKIKKQQKHLSRKKKGSNNFLKCKKKLNSLHYKVVNKRNYFLHLLSNTLVNNFDIIAIENLQVKNMVRNKKLSRSISDTSWSKFTSMLSYKCNWYDKQLVKVNTFFPSSKTCSCCGYKLESLPLDIRAWNCPECGESHDRDVNAAKNIHNEGLRLLGLQT